MVTAVQDHIGGLNFGYRVALRDKKVLRWDRPATFPHLSRWRVAGTDSFSPGVAARRSGDVHEREGRFHRPAHDHCHVPQRAGAFARTPTLALC